MAVNQFPMGLRTHSTDAYIRVLREADTRTAWSEERGNGGPGADGQVGLIELDDYSARLSQQRLFVAMIGHFYKGFFGHNPLAQMLQQIDDKLDIARNLRDNYNQILPQDFVGWNPIEITEHDVRRVAARDGNEANVSPWDLGTFGEPLNPHRPGEHRSDIDYEDNRSIQRAIDAEINANNPYHATIEQLMNIASTLEPESPQMLAVQARIAAIEAEANTTSPYYATIQQLMNIASTLEPESPQMLAVQARLDAILKMSGMSDAQMQRTTLLGQVIQLNDITRDLERLRENLDPDSENTRLLNERLEALQAERLRVIGELEGFVIIDDPVIADET